LTPWNCDYERDFRSI